MINHNSLTREYNWVTKSFLQIFDFYEDFFRPNKTLPQKYASNIKQLAHWKTGFKHFEANALKASFDFDFFTNITNKGRIIRGK